MADEKKIVLKNTFAKDKLRPGTYLARVELLAADVKAAWPLEGDEVVLTRKDGSTETVTIGGKCVWSGPDDERTGVEVALFTIAKSASKRRLPPGVKPPEVAKK